MSNTNVLLNPRVVFVENYQMLHSFVEICSDDNANYNIKQ